MKNLYINPRNGRLINNYFQNHKFTLVKPIRFNYDQNYIDFMNEFYKFLKSNEVYKSKNYIKKLIELFDLKDYVKFIFFSNYIYAAYEEDFRNLVLKKNINITSPLSNNPSFEDKIIIDFLNTIIHELTHAYQYKFKKENKNSNITTLYKISSNMQFFSKSIYKKYHDYFPYEMEAKINAMIGLILFANETRNKSIIHEASKTFVLDFYDENNIFINNKFGILFKQLFGLELDESTFNYLSELDKLCLGLNTSITTPKELIKTI